MTATMTAAVKRASKKASTKVIRVTVGASQPKAGAKTVNAWQDDPASGLPMIQRPVPNLGKKPLAFKIKGTQYPAGQYDAGTPAFRFWTAAEALRRGGDFWAPILGVKQWQPGKVLPVGLDEGEDLNAYYDRTELAFFHQAVQGTTYYSGESPDVVCHEMGHACLDAHRPELWDTPFIEAGAFHESFGDQSAMLSQLQLKGVRDVALVPLAAGRASPWSRCAEQLGAAIRMVAPTAVDSDCLRNAYNRFKYVDPQSLPDDAPATQLCAEVHSFSRVFTGAFYDILSGMLNARSKKPGDADLLAVANDYAKLLLAATAAAPVQPDFFAQVAAHMIDADTANGGTYRQVLTAVFVDRKIIPKAAVAALAADGGGSSTRKAAAAMVGASLRAAAEPRASVHEVMFSGSELGIDGQAVTVRAPVEQRPFLTAAASLAHERAVGQPDRVEQATRRFVKMLVAHDRIDVTSRQKRVAATADGPPRTHAHLKKTHVLVEARGGGLQLVRRMFHCSRCVGGYERHPR